MSLEKLYRKIDRCRFCREEANPLRHIHGAGAERPRLMLVLVNPTARNLSSDPAYDGPRFPFIGVRQFWRVLAEGGLIDKEVARHLPARAGWTGEHTELVRRELVRNKLYLTNLVKCCYGHSAYPRPEVIAGQLKFLAEEIRLVRPERIIAFGGLVFKMLAGKNVKLSEYWCGGPRATSPETISGRGIPVTPCFFPIGRGSPKKASAALRAFAAKKLPPKGRADGKEYLFAYGWLRKPNVQLEVFGRRIAGTGDVLAGWRPSVLKLPDRKYAAIVPDPKNEVRGQVLALTAAELRAADEYETEAYRRAAVGLKSGRRAWVYVRR